MVKERWVLAPCLLAMLFVAFSAQADHWVEEHNYLNPLPGYQVDCSPEDSLGYCIGGVEFRDVEGGDVTVTVYDQSPPTSGEVRWGNGSTSGPVCFPYTFTVSAGDDVVVLLDDSALAAANGWPCAFLLDSSAVEGTVQLAHV